MPATTPTSTIPASLRRLVAITALLAGVLALVGLTPYAAQATPTFTWIGDGANHDWTNPDNWSTGSVPGAGDSVVIDEIAGQTVTVEEIGDVTVANLQIHGGPNHDVRVGYDGVGSLTVTGSMTWTGGDLDVPLSIPAGSTMTISQGHEKNFAPDTNDQITVAGTVVVDDTGTGDDDGVIFYWDSGLRIVAGGTLRSHGDSRLTGQRCCGSDFPSAVDNAGTIEVPDGHLTVETMGLYNSGTINVAHNMTLTDDHGLARLGNATYAGGGRLVFTNTVNPAPQSDHPDRSQGAALLVGTGHLSGGFEFVLGTGSEMTGIGGFDGTGAVELDGGTVYAKAALTGSVTLDVAAGNQSWLWSYDSGVTGYHSDLTIAHGGTVESTGRLTIHPGSKLSVTGGSLGIGKGSSLDSDSCCTNTPELVVGTKGTLDFHGGSAAMPATLKWLTVSSAGALRPQAYANWVGDTITQTGGTTTVGSAMHADNTDFTVKGGTVTGKATYPGTLVNTGGTVKPTGTLTIGGAYTQGNKGTLDVAPGKTSLVVKGTAKVAGNLIATGTAKPGTTRRALSGGSLSGQFSCVRAAGWLPSYTTRAVNLTRIAAKVAGCGHYPKPVTRFAKKVKTKHKAAVKVAFGAGARQVLVQVKVGKPTRTTKVKIWAAGHRVTPLKVKRGHTTSTYVVVPVGSAQKLYVSTSAGTVKVTVRQYGWSK
ncbi:MAG TPA: hypothetical protein VF426_12670 [Marmoricola sp.]